MTSRSSSSNKATINWDSNWQELDLTFGIAINRDGSEQLLEPADYGVTPDGGIQFADVILLGSDSADRVYASFDNYINAKGGNDILFSIDNYTGNQIVGGTGSDTFYLQATNNLILGGEIFANPSSYALSNDVALADFEADIYLIDSSSESISLGQFLKIYDFEIGRDSLVIDGLKVDTANWAAARNLLNSNNIDINATPESTLKRITISLLEGTTTNTDLAPFILDRDNDALRAIKITGPEWIELSGTVLTANTPIGITEEDLKAINLQIGYTDEKAVAPFAAHLTLNMAPTALELTDVITSLDENTDTSQPIKLADIVITDNALGTNIITLSGDDAAVFEVSGNALLLKAGTSLDFEAKSSYNITINVADPDLTTSTPISTPFSLTITDVNEAPIVANPIEDQKAIENTAFNLIIPSNTFADEDINDSLVLSASLSDGTPLPAWLRFDQINNILAGTPTITDTGSISVKITATDLEGASVDDSFTLLVQSLTTQATLIIEGEGDSARFIIVPAASGNSQPLIVEPSMIPEGAQLIFEVQDGVTNSSPIAISFNLIEESATPINLNASTEGGGTIASNAPSGIDFNFNGVYFNSAAGADTIIGSSFNDFLRAGAGDDLIDAGTGDDLIRAGAGNDIITTGDGEDLIYYTADQLDGTSDRVLDFSTSDRIVLGENIRANLNGTMATFATTIDGVDRQATLSFEGSSVVFEEMFITMA